MTVATEGTIMANELQWEGFASMAESGIREALYAAGVDCAMHAWREPEACFAPDYDPYEPANS